MGTNSLPAHEQSPEAVVPGVGALDYPATGLAPNATEQRLLASTPDVRGDAASSHGGLDVLVVVALVEAEVLGATRAARRAEYDRIERLADKPLVVDVGAGDFGGQRDASAVGQNVAFYAGFRAIRRVGTRKIPPFGAFAMALSSEDHFHWMPRLSS